MLKMKHFDILFLCSLLSISVQSKAPYKIKVTRVEIVRCNKQYMDGRFWMTKPNRYTNAVNCEINIYDIPVDTKVKVKMYEFLSNEYRPFAINLERGLCHALDLEYKMMLYPDLLKSGAHMPEPGCPMKPGNYSFANVTPDIDHFPPSLPFRNWLLTVEFWHGPVEISLAKFYGILDRDAVIREQYS